MLPPNETIADLIGRISHKDRAAFDVLYQKSNAKLFGVCLQILKNRPDAEDALQEVFAKIWVRANRYKRSDLTSMSWLVAMARNQAIDKIRSRRKNTINIQNAREVPDPAASPEDLLLSSAEAAELEACLVELEPEKAAAIRGAYLMGDSYRELAARHGVPMNTMRTWLRRGLQTMRASHDRRDAAE